MKIERIMDVDEKFVKSSTKPEAKLILSSNHKFIKPVVFSGLSTPRMGTGWSIGEIKSSGLTKKQMKALHLGIDKFRKTKHEDNVEILKKIKSIIS